MLDDRRIQDTPYTVIFSLKVKFSGSHPVLISTLLALTPTDFVFYCQNVNN